MQDKEKETQLKDYECAFCADALRKSQTILLDLMNPKVVALLSEESIVALARGAEGVVGYSLPLINRGAMKLPPQSPIKGGGK